MLVYDITKRDSFENLETIWIPEIEKRCGRENVQMVLIGNKLDQEQDRKVSKEEGEGLLVKYKMQKFEELSATHNLDTNRPLLEETLATLAQKMWEKNLGSDVWLAECTGTKIKASKDKSCKCSLG